MLLDNQVAVIIDVVSDVGEAMARAFASQGTDLIIADSDADKGQAIRRSICQTFGDTTRVDFIRASSAQADQMQDVVNYVARQKGRLDIVYINTLLARIPMSKAALSKVEWETIMSSSLHAIEQAARSCAPLMTSKGGGAIITAYWTERLLSTLRDEDRDSLGAESEFLSLTRLLATDLAPDIRVNALLVGAMEMANGNRSLLRERETTSEASLLKRFGSPDEVARAGVFLASDLSSYITGTSLVVDGGLSSRVH